MHQYLDSHIKAYSSDYKSKKNKKIKNMKTLFYYGNALITRVKSAFKFLQDS